MEAVQKGSAQWRYLTSSSRDRATTPRTPRPNAVLLRPFSDTDDSSPETTSKCHSPTVEQAPFCSVDERLLIDEAQVLRRQRHPSRRSDSVCSTGSNLSDDQLVPNAQTPPIGIVESPAAAIARCLSAASRSLHALIVRPSEVSAMEDGPLKHIPSTSAVIRHSLTLRTRGVVLLRRTVGTSLVVGSLVRLFLSPATTRARQFRLGAGWLGALLWAGQVVPLGTAAALSLLHVLCLRAVLAPPSAAATTPLFGVGCQLVILTKVAVSCITENHLCEGRVSSSTAALLYLRQRTLLSAFYTFLHNVGGSSVITAREVPIDRQEMLDHIAFAGGIVQSLLWLHCSRARPLGASAGRSFAVDQFRFVASSLWLLRHRRSIEHLHDHLRATFIVDSIATHASDGHGAEASGAYRELFLHAQRASGLLFELQALPKGSAADHEMQEDLREAMERLSNSWYRHVTTTLLPVRGHKGTHLDGDSALNDGESHCVDTQSLPPQSRQPDVLDATAQGVHPIPLYPKETLDDEEGADMRGALPADFMAQLQRTAAGRTAGNVVADDSESN